MNMTVPTTKSVNRTMLVGYIVSLVVMLGVIGVGWYYILNTSDTANKYNTEIYTMKAQADELSELSWRYQRVLPKRSVVKEAIPDTKDESTFMADLESLAQKHGLVITNSKIGSTQAKTSKSGDFSQTLSKGDYFELPIRYEVKGQYSEFVKFIGELSTLRRLNSVNDLSVTADFSDKAAVGTIRGTFVVTIYAKK